ncbi:hypothetical protein [Paraburkholderia pallida]|uniref:Uncharacterized protein n=1 Tax=Paraburkholderia pallida TaxID=2547399 RepID=A0A4P7CKJ7_9BURK|nr:hypothetical protein [Paraburkholderia pallida]QBQ96295.1 hypothetical protein E1956_03315 [Paraburkholderia pallida]
MKKPPHLFDSSAELKSMMEKLERSDNATAYELLRRIGAQRAALPELGKFSRSLDQRAYRNALDLVPAVAARTFRSVDELETRLLRLEIDFTRAAARAHRSNSAVRFDGFWEIFDEIVRRRTCTTAMAAYRAAVDAGAPLPHPRQSTAKTRFKELMGDGSERLRIAG